MKLNADGTGTIVTGAQENGSGAVMGLPLLAAQVLGMQPGGLLDPLPGHRRRARRTCGSSGSQTTFNNGRAVDRGGGRGPRASCCELASEQLEIDPLDLELRDGAVQRQGLAAEGGPDRRARRDAARRSSARDRAAVPEAPECNPDSGCLGRLGMESFLEPQLITHAVHVRVDRETGVVRVLRVAAAHDSGTILNPIGAEGQVRGGVVMGIGQALSRGHAARRRRPPAQPAPARLQARDGRRRAADRDRVGADAGRERRSERLEGGRRAAVRADAGGGRQRDREGDREARHRLPMTPERVWEAQQ